MNIHLPAILMFTRGTRFWHTAKWGKTIHGNVWKRQRKSSGCHSFGALAVSYGTLSCCMCQEYHRSLWWAWWLRLPTDARRWAISKNWSGDGKLLTIWSDLGRCWPSRIRMIRWVAKSAKWHLANSWSLMSLDLPPGWFQCLTYSLPQGTRRDPVCWKMHPSLTREEKAFIIFIASKTGDMERSTVAGCNDPFPWHVVICCVSRSGVLFPVVFGCIYWSLPMSNQ